MRRTAGPGTRSLVTCVADEVDDPARRLRQLLGVGGRELLTTVDVARDYKFPTAEAARKWLGRHAKSFCRHRGRALLIDRRDLDAVIDELTRTGVQSRKSPEPVA